MNEATFREAGVFVPRTGRTSVAYAGHHNIAWDLARTAPFDPALGTFDDLLTEIAAAGAPTVSLSSEEFEFLHSDDAALHRLNSGLRSIGYEPRIVVYLRPQADYVESLYAELSRVWNIPFSDFLDTIVTAGIYGRSLFDYGPLLDAFARAFGSSGIIVRAYRAGSKSDTLLHEFAALIAPALAPVRLTVPPRLNSMLRFADVVAARERHLACTVPYRAPADQRFDPLDIADIARLFVRFTGSNQRIARRFGTRIACAGCEIVARELITEIFHDRESHHRKRLIRALIETEGESSPAVYRLGTGALRAVTV
jgi:hypothetical protein